MRRHFVSTPEGIDVRLSGEERALLGQLLNVVGSVGADQSDPALARLHPPAYPDDPAAEREFRRLTSSDLDEERAADREVIAATLSEMGRRTRIDQEEAERWVRVLGEARLVLAARRGVLRDEADYAALDPRDPEVAVIHYLAYLQEDLVGALSAELGTRP